ncbi:transcriptional regulator GcvA [Cocleimonas sp. KMM 6892]|uniref:transcriptional regulator GcvA n=1 Tax=unclassified Cocleimonas TaxID=2639732 RepID=UPI002DBA56A1|nr:MULTISPECIES: transcriptional regulator GcvA [unclassified Cocleimonas]MEB8431101.1 transcriptional regulator GcvA [Cocleimonas sp. KMM 6892]MEC4714127.1 transcriptional regulator GcvA [Cocleimonas sp. KMM 6895]MEC4743458.1 transcriptional regulator GcvA [Cocleimonas sp. KMM 6896]
MRRLPPLNSIRAFEATARHLSFSKAAEELNVTPGAVSQQVKVLEDYLNIKLFKRRNRLILLTDEAQICLPLLTQGLDNMAHAIDLIRKQNDDKPLTITASPTFTSRWLMPRLSSFQHEFPDIDVRIDASNDLADLINDDIDVGIRFGTGEYPGLEADYLFSQSVIAVCNPELLKRKDKLKTPEDLKHHTLLHAHGDYFFIDNTHVDWEMWFATVGAKGIDGRHGLHFSQHNLLVEAAIRGQGVALVGDVVVNDELKTGQLVKLFEDTDIPLKFSYYLIYPNVKSNLPRVKIFRQWLLDEVKKVRRK